MNQRGLRDGAPLPEPRGRVSGWLVRRLLGRPTLADRPVAHGDPLVGDDLHLALHCIYELSHRPLRGVDPAFERDPLVLALRRSLEDELWDAVQDDALLDEGDRWAEVARRSGPGAAVDGLLEAFDGPSLSSFMEQRGTREQFLEFLIHRSAYQLKEADPHTLGLARLTPGARKSAYAEIQYDEYGNGEPGASHAELFAAAMAEAGLDAGYGTAIDALPGTTLATGNLLGLLSGRRELLAPLVGHLALFEMTSVTPMGRYARAARRLGFGPSVQRFYDVHVEADAHHGDLARRVLLGDGGSDDDLDPVGMVLGAHALVRAEDRFARSLLDRWAEGGSSLRIDDDASDALGVPGHNG